MKYFKNIYNRLTLFDFILVLIFILSIIFFAVVSYRKTDFVIVTVKVGDDDIRQSIPGVKDWFSQLFYVGMRDIDGLGKPQAEVIDILSYDYSPNQKALYLTLKLRALYTQKTNKYTFKGRPLLIAHPIKLELDNLSVSGLVTSMEDVKDPREKVTIIVQAQAWNESPSFSETIGIRPYIADAIKVGDKVLDSQGNVLLEVVDKKIENAKRVIFVNAGQSRLGENPLLKDIKLTLKIQATRINDKYYFFDDVPIRIGTSIPINLPFLSIWPEITNITSVE